MARGRGKKESRRRSKRNEKQMTQAIERSTIEATVSIRTGNVEFATPDALPSTSGAATIPRVPAHPGTPMDSAGTSRTNLPVASTSRAPPGQSATARYQVQCCCASGLACTSRTNLSVASTSRSPPGLVTTPTVMASRAAELGGGSRTNETFAAPHVLQPRPGPATTSRAVESIASIFMGALGFGGAITTAESQPEPATTPRHSWFSDPPRRTGITHLGPVKTNSSMNSSASRVAGASTTKAATSPFERQRLENSLTPEEMNDKLTRYFRSITHQHIQQACTEQSEFGSVSNPRELNSSASGLVSSSNCNVATGSRGKNTGIPPGSQIQVKEEIPAVGKVSSSIRDRSSDQSARAKKKGGTLKSKCQEVPKTATDASTSNPGSSVHKETETMEKQKGKLDTRYSGLHMVPSPFRNRSARVRITPTPLSTQLAPPATNATNTGGASNTTVPQMRQWFNTAFDEVQRRETMNRARPPLNTVHDVARDVSYNLLHAAPRDNSDLQSVSPSTSQASTEPTTPTEEGNHQNEYPTLPLLVELQSEEYRTLMEYLYLDTLYHNQNRFYNPLLHYRCFLMCYIYQPVIYNAMIKFIRKVLMPGEELSFVRRVINAIMDYIIPRGNLVLRLSMWMKRLNLNNAKAIAKNQAVSPASNFDLQNREPVGPHDNPEVAMELMKKLVIFLGLQTKKELEMIEKCWKKWIRKVVKPLRSVPNGEPMPSTARAPEGEGPVDYAAFNKNVHLRIYNSLKDANKRVEDNAGYWWWTIISVSRQERKTVAWQWLQTKIVEVILNPYNPSPPPQQWGINSSQATAAPPSINSAEEDELEQAASSSQASTVPLHPHSDELEQDTVSSQASTTPLHPNSDELEQETVSSQASAMPPEEYEGMNNSFSGEDGFESDTDSQATTIPPEEQEVFSDDDDIRVIEHSSAIPLGNHNSSSENEFER